ncbi:hypothetical protein E2C01_096135 [Portunus trituberculatus]|uniref:Uncharacterized protein n=1 Tax=Portunus trituberculatus TaxID=210409 RepID=A0A5B7K5U1_PORTR|nr:hypothetical protein [Portunus trituberculatus]
MSQMSHVLLHPLFSRSQFQFMDKRKLLFHQGNLHWSLIHRTL